MAAKTESQKFILPEGGSVMSPVREHDVSLDKSRRGFHVQDERLRSFNNPWS